MVLLCSASSLTLGSYGEQRRENISAGALGGVPGDDTGLVFKPSGSRFAGQVFLVHTDAAALVDHHFSADGVPWFLNSLGLLYHCASSHQTSPTSPPQADCITPPSPQLHCDIRPLRSVPTPC